jgi:hypothetical protein
MSLTNLASAVSGNNAFETTNVDEAALVKEYFERNERKKEDEKWLEKNKTKLKAILARNERDKMDFGDVRVSVVVPDTSKFDIEKMFDYFVSEGLIDAVTKQVIDEGKVAALIEEGKVDVDALKEAAWVESTGTPRLTVSKARKGD